MKTDIENITAFLACNIECSIFEKYVAPVLANYEAQPSIGVAEGWRPIETAPKDGTVILALQCWIFHTDAARRPHYVLHEVFFNDEGGWEIVEDGEILDDDSLSHWLPRDRLSAAPVSQEVGK